MTDNFTIDLNKKAHEYTNMEISELLKHVQCRLDKTHKAISGGNEIEIIDSMPGVPTLLLFSHALLTAMQMRLLRKVSSNE